MANAEHLKILKQGAEVWNQWRQENLEVQPDLIEADLYGIFIGRANLREIDLRGADIRKAYLSGADLSYTDLSGAKLSGADFKETNLKKAKLIRADLSEANFKGADLQGANLSEAYLVKTYVNTADLSEADLKGAKLVKTKLSRANLIDADLSEVDLYETILDSAFLYGAQFIKAHLYETNLIGADLSSADFEGADFKSADLQRAILCNANLSRADLSRVKLEDANLKRANLSEANLSGVDLSRADLTEANLEGANLNGVILIEADLTNANLYKTDLSKAKVGNTKFGDTDLSEVLGLDAVEHIRPSTIGIDTIYRSKGKISKIFLRGAGLSDTFITYIASLSGEAIQYYSCFISYSSKDEILAQRLYADLQQKGVRCWFAPEDMKIGEKIRPRIDESIRIHDKLLLILSENSLNSFWVESEVEKAFEEERKRNQTVLFPVRLDETVLETDQAWAADIRRTRHIGDFSQWKDHDAYQQAFERLLRDLKAEG